MNNLGRNKFKKNYKLNMWNIIQKNKTKDDCFLFLPPSLPPSLRAAVIFSAPCKKLFTPSCVISPFCLGGQRQRHTKRHAERHTELSHRRPGSSLPLFPLAADLHTSRPCPSWYLHNRCLLPRPDLQNQLTTLCGFGADRCLQLPQQALKKKKKALKKFSHEYLSRFKWY